MRAETGVVKGDFSVAALPPGLRLVGLRRGFGEREKWEGAAGGRRLPFFWEKADVSGPGDPCGLLEPSDALAWYLPWARHTRRRTGTLLNAIVCGGSFDAPRWGLFSSETPPNIDRLGLLR